MAIKMIKLPLFILIIQDISGFKAFQNLAGKAKSGLNIFIITSGFWQNRPVKPA